MPKPEQYDVRQAILDLLFEKVSNDRYPSISQLNMIEDLLAEPDEIAAYVEMLLEKLRADRIPSVPLMRRLQKFA